MDAMPIAREDPWKVARWPNKCRWRYSRALHAGFPSVRNGIHSEISIPKRETAKSFLFSADRCEFSIIIELSRLKS